MQIYESLDEINEQTLLQENDNEYIDEQDLEPLTDVTEEKSKRKTRRTKPVIPPEATPLEVFMLEKEFHMAELAGITKLSKEELLGVIRGDVPTEHQKYRIRLTTGVKL